MASRNARHLDTQGGDAVTYFFHSATLFALSFVIYQLSTIGRHLMSMQETVDALTAQVAKIQSEVIAARDVLTVRLAEVQAQLDAAGSPVDLSALENAIQALDDINPDEPAE